MSNAVQILFLIVFATCLMVISISRPPQHNTTRGWLFSLGMALIAMFCFFRSGWLMP